MAGANSHCCASLPRFALVDTAGEHDNQLGARAGRRRTGREVVIFGKAYLDFAHLADLARRGVSWVTRAKDNLRYP